MTPERSTDAEVHQTIGSLEPFLTPRQYRAGQVLWTEGERSGRLVVLDEGRVKILRARPDGQQVLLYVFGPGELFGFLPFVDGGPYPATAVALDDVHARVMSRSALREALTRDPQLALGLLQALGKRLREAFARIDALGHRNAPGRAAAALVALLPADPQAGTSILHVPEPAYEFAAEIGMTPETFSRALRSLVDAGVIHRLGPGRLQLLDETRLSRLAAGKTEPGNTG